MRSDLKNLCDSHRGLLLILVPALILAFYFLFPFLSGIILGTVFAYVGRPIRDLFLGRRRLGSAIATICIIMPIAVILGLGALEAINLTIWLAQHETGVRLMLGRSIEGLSIPPLIYESLAGNIQEAAGLALSILGGIPLLEIGRSASMGILNFIISIPVCYFLLVDGEMAVESILRMVTLEKRDICRKYFSKIDRIWSGIFLGSIYTAIVGGLISAMVFYAFGVPRPFALASIVFIAGMVPILTAWVVLVPVALYRYLTMGPAEAVIFLLVASSLIYIPSELFIRPYLISAKSSLHPLLVMLSFFGGMLVAGIGGFFLAPAIMGVLAGIYQVRSEEIEVCRLKEPLE